MGALAPTSTHWRPSPAAAPARPDACRDALDDVPQPLDTSPPAATERVERQVAIEIDASVLDKIQRLAFLAKPVGFQPVDHRRRKAVIDLRDIDILRREPGTAPT